MPIEVRVVHDGGVSTLFARSPFWSEAVVKALAVAPLAPTLVEGMRVKPQEPHERVQLAHLGQRRRVGREAAERGRGKRENRGKARRGRRGGLDNCFP